MTDDDLYFHITRALKSKQAQRLCQGRHVSTTDVVGELYLKLRSLANSEVITNPGGWVFTNSIGYLKNHLSKEYGTKRVPSDLEYMAKKREQIDPMGLVADQLDVESIARSLAAELERLPAEERDAVKARAGIGEFSCRALAAKTGLCPQTVCTRANKGIRKLQTALRKLGEGYS